MSDNIRLVQTVIDYVESHLTERLDLDAVAQAAHYSKYHLHRIFTETVGLTLFDYSQRRRLTEAAKLLVFSNRPILDIALLAGYSSQQSFTNIFTALYKLSPRRYREGERFYPLQLRFNLEQMTMQSPTEKPCQWTVAFAIEEDIPGWMDLVHLVIDGFPNLQEAEYLSVLQGHIQKQQALLLREGSTMVGVLLFSYETGSIEFVGTHPLYRSRGVPQTLLTRVEELLQERQITITTFRAGDRADTGHRKTIMELGFAEAELLTEFGYPTQRFILPREDLHNGT